jgi:hypothetical protein
MGIFAGRMATTQIICVRKCTVTFAIAPGKPHNSSRMTVGKKTSDPASLLARHWQALVFVCTVIVPLILRTRRRPVIFSRWSGMGDIICNSPVAIELKKHHPDFAAVQLENEP